MRAVRLLTMKLACSEKMILDGVETESKSDVWWTVARWRAPYLVG